MLVSVVMATYNRMEYVSAAIESVLNQTHRDLELVIVDDHSTDATFDIVSAYAEQDPRIRAIRNSENKGLATSCNIGLSLAKSDLIARHDDDDIMRPDRLARQLKFMCENPHFSVVSSWALLIDSGGRVVGRSAPRVDMTRGLSREDPALLVDIIHPASMYRKDAVMQVGGYRSVQLEDRDLWGRLITEGHQIGVQPEFLLYHRKHGKSLMMKDLDSLFEYGDFIDFNIVRRLRGETELSLDEYRALRRSLSGYARFVARTRRRSQMAFRQATLFYGSRKWAPFVRCLSEALVLAPYPTVRRIWEKW